MLNRMRLSFLCIGFLALLSGCTNPQSGTAPIPTATATIVPSASAISLAPTPARKLELGTFTIPTPVPTPTPTVVTPTPSPSPGGTCALEGDVTNGCQCQSIPLAIPGGGIYNFQEQACSPSQPWDCQFMQICQGCGYSDQCLYTTLGGSPLYLHCQMMLQELAQSTGPRCIGKPVIYLYPTQTQAVSVTLTIPGPLTTSNPIYPAGGWKVVAHPNGQLDYLGNIYHELYYEDTVNTVKAPSTGIVLRADHLAQDLKLITMQIGLNDTESDEFLLYWLPKLQALHSPYMFFSILDTSEKERIDHVTISPKPDTQIQFLAYFKPLAKPINIPSLTLPNRPDRIGFTSVEWGGTIDY